MIASTTITSPPPHCPPGGLPGIPAQAKTLRCESVLWPVTPVGPGPIGASGQPGMLKGTNRFRGASFIFLYKTTKLSCGREDEVKGPPLHFAGVVPQNSVSRLDSQRTNPVATLYPRGLDAHEESWESPFLSARIWQCCLLTTPF